MRVKLLLATSTAFVIAACMATPNAGAWNNNNGGNDSYGPGSGGGAVGLPFNDLWGINRSSIRFWLNGPEGHNNLTSNCTHSFKAPGAGGVSLSGSVCEYPKVVWSGDDFRDSSLTNPPSPRSYWGGIFKSGYRMAAHLKDDIGISTSACGVGRGARYFNGCPGQIYNFSGTDYTKRAGGGSYGQTGWSQMHAATPGDLKPKNSLGSAVYGNGDQGRTVIGVLRIWRDCPDGDKRWTKGGCIKEPIYSRTPPSSDHPYNRKDYFFRAWNGNRNTDQAVHSSVGAVGNEGATLAGHLYDRCPTKKYCHSINGGGVVGGVQSNTANGPFEKSCFSGSLGSGTVWTAEEFKMQAAFSYRKDLTTYNKLAAWADSGPGGAHPNGWPPVISHATACAKFSEWLAVDWAMSDFKGKRNAWKINMSMNTIPGRVYVAQTVGIDPRENPTKEIIATFTSKASHTTCTGNSCSPPPQCYDVAKYQDTGEIAPVQVSKDPTKAGGYNWDDPRVAAACKSESNTTKNAPAQEPPGLNTKFVQSQLAGQSTTPEYEGFTAPVDQGTNASDTAVPNTTWIPRALQAAIFNPQDAVEADPAKAYKANHMLSSSRRTDTKIADRFTLGSVTPLSDSMNIPGQDSGTGTDGASSQGTGSKAWADLATRTQVKKPGGSATQSLAEANWWKVMLPLHNFVTDTGSDGSGYGLPGLGNSLQIAVNNTTLSQPDSDRKDIIAAQSALNALQTKTNAGGLTADEIAQQNAAQAKVDNLDTQRDLKYNETRMVSMLGESRYAANWKLGVSCDSRHKSNDPKTWCSATAPELRHERLTLDKCTPESPQLLLNPRTETDSEGHAITDYSGSFPCASGTISTLIGDGLKISDAYTVPPIAPGAPSVELSSNFRQEKNADGSSAPAFLSFDAETADRSQNITPYTSRIEIWKLSDYRQRSMQPASDATTDTPGDAPSSDAPEITNPCTGDTSTDDAANSSGCNDITDDTETPVDSTDTTDATAGDSTDVANSTDAAGADGTDAETGNNEAPLYAVDRTGLTLGNGAGKPSSQPYIEFCPTNNQTGSCSKPCNCTWQPNARLVDPAKYSDPVKRVSGDIFSQTTTESGLPAGDYVVVVVLDNPKSDAGTNSDSPAVARWGIDAYLNDYSERVWASWFTVTNAQTSVAVYQSRATG